MPCRVDRSREWTTRMMFESKLHAHSIFVTLTYEDLPDNAEINKRDAQLFLKRLRKRLAGENNPRKARYFLCGEYGGERGRPHYHAVIFGLSVLDTPLVEASWQRGFVQVSELTPGRMAYTAKYLHKAVLGKREREDGRCKEFALMSRRPGLGSAFITALAQGIKRQADNPDVSLAGLARMDGRTYPIDRYGRNLLQSALVDMGVPWRDAERLVVGSAGEGTTEDGQGSLARAQKKMDRQDRYERQARGREKVLRGSSTRVH